MSLWLLSILNGLRAVQNQNNQDFRRSFPNYFGPHYGSNYFSSQANLFGPLHIRQTSFIPFPLRHSSPVFCPDGGSFYRHPGVIPVRQLRLPHLPLMCNKNYGGSKQYQKGLGSQIKKNVELTSLKRKSPETSCASASDQQPQISEQKQVHNDNKPVTEQIIVVEAAAEMKEDLKLSLQCKEDSQANEIIELPAKTHFNNNSSSNPSKKAQLCKESPRKDKTHTSRTGEKKKIKTHEINPEDLYCKLCDVSFNSSVQSKQHYNGKNHHRKLRGEPAFKKAFPHSNGKKPRLKYNCTLCSVKMTSHIQLDIHLSGLKHKNKLALQGQTGTTLQGRWSGNAAESGAVVMGTSGRLEDLSQELPLGISIITDEEGDFIPPTKRSKYRDFSMYRTPSGKYYCSCCNVTLNSEAQFSQHFDSKKHKINNAAVKTTPSIETMIFS